MVEIVAPGADHGLAEAAQLLHDFNREYDEPAPEPEELVPRLRALVAEGRLVLLLARDAGGTPVGVAAMRVQPAIIGLAQEAYLAELYVVPDRRGQGFGRELITQAMATARDRGADYAFLVTTVADEQAVRLYEAAGFRRTEGEDGPLMVAFERDL